MGATVSSAIEVVWASIPPITFLRHGRFCNLVSKCIAAPVDILYTTVQNMLFFYQVQTNRCYDSNKVNITQGDAVFAVIRQITVHCKHTQGIGRPQGKLH